jgi:hypothetical protein
VAGKQGGKGSKGESCKEREREENSQGDSVWWGRGKGTNLLLRGKETGTARRRGGRKG